MSFNSLLFPQKSSFIAVRLNSKYVSDTFLTIFTAILLKKYQKYLKKYQIFRADTFQDVSEDLILSKDLISLFPSI